MHAWALTPVLALAASMLATPTNEWYNCPWFSTVGNETMPEFTYQNTSAQSMYLDVPLCYDNVCSTKDKTLSVFVKRYPAAEPSTPPKSVKYLQGGPGYASNSRTSTTAGFMSLYTMDHRGTRRSTRLEALCPNQTYTTNTAWFTGCIGRIKDTYGPDAPKGFSQLAKDDVYVYGASYGTYLGYILDGVMSESPVSYFPHRDRNAADVETTCYCICDRDPACSYKLNRNVKQFTLNVFKKLDANDTVCAQTIFAAQGTPSTFLGAVFTKYI
ncbi:hypothetical protein SDRG_00320 [Saprolegnia diclina VS20]|uniref:Uncharacterized protein n=1 Tax=Saprolegnia diclina (strain VS20) TaxID=1156394 RepID=T0R6P3_SAPDV|nr:hypothetical protein SDRG_00320 [Saprolegnia diclina VS20]EQC42591.1 hypothetical protein SDRG_00320 [Saprolegnia diclina VS20]|eukprot:XP_008604014.1 hypothetical protein SDRG_00320 [Saprolegnia diclina VS20]